MTPEQESRLATLRAVLPPVYVDCWPPGGIVDGSRICVDLEWDEVTGALETIGFGNEKWVCQFNWTTLAEKSRDNLRTALLPTLATTPVVFHNADGDIRKLRANGFAIRGPEQFYKLEDSMLAHAVLHSELGHTLEELCETYGKLPAHKDFRTVPGAESTYNAADVVSTCLVWDAIAGELAADVQSEFIYRTQSLPFLWLAIEGEEEGIRVAEGVPEVLFAVNDLKRQQASRLLQAHTGRLDVNINSPDQIKHLLYNVEGLPVQRDKAASWAEEGKATSDKDAIAALRRMRGTEWEPDEEPTLEQALANVEAGGNAVLEARYLHMGAQQSVTHYIRPLMGVARIYPECRIHVQASGRVGYVGPALPQMKGDLLKQITPDVGTCWVGHDWKQIEVRLLAVLANDTVYLEAFARGDDIHEINARAVFGPKGSHDLEALRRRWIKAYVFRLHYRGKPENAGDIPGTRALFGMDTTPLVKASEAYLALHPALPAYWAEIEAESDRTSCVRTFMGRPRRLTSPYRNARLREASNMPMQGGVSDIFISTALLVKKAAPWSRLVFGAYDSMWFQVPVERRLEFLLLYAPTVEREFQINGRAVSFPADWKFREAA